VTLSAAGNIVADYRIDHRRQRNLGSDDISTSPNALGGYVTTVINGNAGVVAMSSAGIVAIDGTLRGPPPPAQRANTRHRSEAGSAEASHAQADLARTWRFRRKVPKQGAGVGIRSAEVGRWRVRQVKAVQPRSDRFDGNVSLSAARSIELSAPVLNVAAGNALVSSAHVSIDGPSTDLPTR